MVKIKSSVTEVCAPMEYFISSVGSSIFDDDNIIVFFFFFFLKAYVIELLHS